MPHTVSNPHENVNQPIIVSLPTPRGQAVVFEGLPPNGISPRLFEDLPHYAEWLPGGEGVRSREKLPVQVKYPDRITIEHQHVIILTNGRLCLGHDIRNPYQYINRFSEGKRWVDCYADKKQRPNHEVYLDGRITMSLWEYIFQEDQDLYWLFEMLGDGIDLDPLMKHAIFQSEESARVFRRQHPDYFCHYHTPLLYAALRDGMEIDEVWCRATFRSRASAEAFRRAHPHWEVGYVETVARGLFPEDMVGLPFAQISPQAVR